MWKYVPCITNPTINPDKKYPSSLEGTQPSPYASSSSAMCVRVRSAVCGYVYERAVRWSQGWCAPQLAHECLCVSECVCADTARSGRVPSPGVYVGGPARPLAGDLGPLWFCRGFAMRCAHRRVRRVPLGAVRQVPGPQGGGGREGGWETGSSAGQLSVLIG